MTAAKNHMTASKHRMTAAKYHMTASSKKANANETSTIKLGVVIVARIRLNNIVIISALRLNREGTRKFKEKNSISFFEGCTNTK